MNLNFLNQLNDKAQAYMAWETPKKITWCSNCGNYGIQNALKRALTLEGLGVQDVMLCFDVGCNGNGSDKMEAYTIHGLHGRVLPLAAGCALANPSMKVIASAGDGATFGEGVNHLVHAVRNNIPVLFLHHNNENYGLTTGQASSCTRPGMKRLAAKEGVQIANLNPVDVVLSLKPSFVARTFSGEIDHMTEMIQLGLRHQGFAFIDIFQACPTYNRETTDDWYASRIQDIRTKKDHDTRNLLHARAVAQMDEAPIYIGLLYEDPTRISLEKTFVHRTEKPKRDISSFLAD